MRSLRPLLLIVICSLNALDGSAQTASPILTQGFLLSHPALAGWHGGVGVYSNYLNHHTSWKEWQVSYGAGADAYVHKLHSAFALNYHHNQQINYHNASPSVSSNHLQFHWAPRLKLAESTYISTSFSYEFLYQRYDWSQLTFASDMYERPFPYPDEPFMANTSYHGLGGGMAFIRRGFWFSANCSFINRPNPQGVEELPFPSSYTQWRLWTASVGQRLHTGDRLVVIPGASYFQANDQYGFAASLNVERGAFQAGLRYSIDQSFSTSIGYEVRKRVRIHYGTGFGIVPNSTQLSVSHEFGLRALLQSGKIARMIENIPVL